MGVDEDVRGFQTIVEMIRSINCPSLVQLGLVFTKKSRRATLSGFNRAYHQLRHMSPFYKNDWEEVDFTALFIDLVERLPKLFFPSATTLQCKAATATLESHFRPTRPCFCVQITKSLTSINPSLELQRAAVYQNNYVIQFIENPLPEIQLAAIREHPGVIGVIKNPTPEAVELARSRGYNTQGHYSPRM